jgi:hypothetical protein
MPRDRKLPQRLHDAIVSNEGKSFRLLYLRGTTTVFACRFKPRDTHALTWAAFYYRRHLDWQVIPDRMENTNDDTLGPNVAISWETFW